MAPGPIRPPDDPRRYQTRLNRELALGGIAIAAIVGGALVNIIWGVRALIGAAIIFAILLALVVVVALVLRLLDWAARER